MKPTETLIKNLDIFYRSETVPKVKIGDKVRVTIFLELTKEETETDTKKTKKKERIQSYEGVVISKHGSINQIDSTITVRKMFQNGGIEKVFLLHSPWIKDIQILNSAKVRRGKLYYLRERKGKSARLKRIF